ncbi:MAG: lipoate--protein ligase family protein [Actinomycetia bacterium]|nr:lipoate--protein ligase family protein [Actinomycetes bacterium]
MAEVRPAPAGHAPIYRWIVVDPATVGDRFRLSPVLAEAVARTAAGGRPVVLVRRQPRYALLGPKDRRLPYLDRAVRSLEQDGWPTFMRVGGGSAVLLDDHALSFAVARPCRDLTLLERNFRELAAGVLTALEHLGLPARFGAAAGSYCEGPFDVVVDGRKVAGIAQAIRAGYALVSGMILVDQDPEATTARLQAFYREAGSPVVLRADAVTNLHRLGVRVSVPELVDHLRRGFARHLRLEADDLTAEEWARAESLYAERRWAAARGAAAL